MAMLTPAQKPRGFASKIFIVDLYPSKSDRTKPSKHVIAFLLQSVL
jgi:hypothetical protein